MEKAKSILSEEEIQRFVDLGLGRGVDSTNPRPWLNKSSFQVRHATFGNVIGTDEGGFIQCYKSQIVSKEELQTEFKASGSIPNTPVKFGLEGEAFRGSSTSKKIIGKKVINRTVSFRMDPLITDELSREDDEQELRVARKMQLPFEEAISAWIWKQVCHRKGLKGDKQAEMKENGVIVLSKYLQDATKEEVALIVDDCADFIRSFGITHYVSSLTLGASKHTVMTESEYSTIVKQGFNVSATQIDAQQKMSLSTKSSKSASVTQYLGKIVDDQVERSSTNEAVIEVKILPLHSLIHHNQLIHLALHKALTDYAEDKSIEPTGPYVIECGDDQMYWKVASNESNHLLTTTKDFKKASIFHVMDDDETDDPYDFKIGWKGDILQDIIERSQILTGTKASSKIMRYLKVKTSLFGHYPGPLKLTSKLGAKDSRLCLYSRIMNDYFDSPADFHPWIKDKEAFFISSANRKSFVAVQRYRQTDPASENEYKYTTKCVRSQKRHNEKNTWMLFRLLAARSCVDSTQPHQSKKVSILEGSEKKMNEKLTKLLEA